MSPLEEYSTIHCNRIYLLHKAIFSLPSTSFKSSALKFKNLAVYSGIRRTPHTERGMPLHINLTPRLVTRSLAADDRALTDVLSLDANLQ